MKSWIIIFSFLYSAVAAADTCYKGEINFRSRAYFADENEYKEELERWEERSPEIPSLFSLYSAYKLYSNEKSFVSSIKSDKVAHCYMGCRISQSTNYQTANYVGWLKEDRDLRDCNPRTHYDEADYIATQRGAQIGENSSADCLSSCRQIYQRRSKNH